jgi:hypothetical protein
MADLSKMKFVDEETANKEAGAVMCAMADTPTPFDDNITGACDDCGAAIIWRPHAPKAAKKICLRCGMIAIAKDEAEVKEVQFLTTDKTEKELPFSLRGVVEAMKRAKQ